MNQKITLAGVVLIVVFYTFCLVMDSISHADKPVVSRVQKLEEMRARQEIFKLLK